MAAHARRWWRRTEDTAHLKRCLWSWTPKQPDVALRRKRVTAHLDELLHGLGPRRPTRTIDVRRRAA